MHLTAKARLAFAVMVLAAACAPAAAQTPPYAGKQIHMVIAAGAGGGYDAYARTLALHLPRHIAGNPNSRLHGRWQADTGSRSGFSIAP